MGSVLPKSLREEAVKERPEPHGPLDPRPFNELSAQEQWELVKAVQFVKDWNRKQPTEFATRPKKAAGRPSYEYERERGIVT